MNQNKLLKITIDKEYLKEYLFWISFSVNCLRIVQPNHFDFNDLVNCIINLLFPYYERQVLISATAIMRKVKSSYNKNNLLLFITITKIPFFSPWQWELRTKEKGQ